MNDKANKLGFEQDVVRLPGQSVDEELSDFFEDKVDSYLSLIALSIALMSFSVITWFVNPPNPIWVSVGCLPIIIYAIYKLKGAKGNIANLRRGRDGERYVGQLLEQLRADGHVVFHDIIGPGFNLDHVIIGQNGIYVVETKTWGKGGSGGAISYDGKDFVLNGKILPKNPIHQVQSGARWLSNMLRESTGKGFSVKPIIALPSWFIKPELNKSIHKEGVSLVNPKVIGTFLKNNKTEMSDEDIHLSSYHLSLHIKAKKVIEER